MGLFLSKSVLATPLCVIALILFKHRTMPPS